MDEISITVVIGELGDEEFSPDLWYEKVLTDCDVAPSWALGIGRDPLRWGQYGVRYSELEEKARIAYFLGSGSGRVGK